MDETREVQLSEVPVPASERDDDDLLSLIDDEDEPARVFREVALLAFGKAGAPLATAFAELYGIALEDARYQRELSGDDLFQAEVAALERDLAAAQSRAAYLAHQGPLRPGSASQVRATAALAEVAKGLRELRRQLQATL